MTAVQIAPIPEDIFAAPRVHGYRDQRWLVRSAKEVREARRALRDGDMQLFLHLYSTASLYLGAAPEITPSWKRVCRVLSRFSVEAAKHITVGQGGGGR